MDRRQELFYRCFFVAAVLFAGIQVNVDTLNSPITWATLAMGCVGAWILAANIPPYIDSKMDEIEAYLERLGMTLK